jgi:hypothetical protein
MNTTKPDKVALKQLIAAAILNRLRNPKKETRPKPTIEELERLLNSDNSQPVEILPTGEITVELPTYASDLADAVLEVLPEYGEDRKG